MSARKKTRTRNMLLAIIIPVAITIPLIIVGISYSLFPTGMTEEGEIVTPIDVIDEIEEILTGPTIILLDDFEDKIIGPLLPDSSTDWASSTSNQYQYSNIVNKNGNQVLELSQSLVDIERNLQVSGNFILEYDLESKGTSEIELNFKGDTNTIKIFVITTNGDVWIYSNDGPIQVNFHTNNNVNYNVKIEFNHEDMNGDELFPDHKISLIPDQSGELSSVGNWFTSQSWEGEVSKIKFNTFIGLDSAIYLDDIVLARQ